MKGVTMDYECLDCGNTQDYSEQCHTCNSYDVAYIGEKTEPWYGYDNEYKIDLEKGN